MGCCGLVYSDICGGGCFSGICEGLVEKSWGGSKLGAVGYVYDHWKWDPVVFQSVSAPVFVHLVDLWHLEGNQCRRTNTGLHLDVSTAGCALRKCLCERNSYGSNNYHVQSGRTVQKRRKRSKNKSHDRRWGFLRETEHFHRYDH